MIHNKISLPTINIYKKVISNSHKETPPCIRMDASYMVELSVVLPFFTGFLVVLLFFFQVLMVEQEVGNALLATGRELSVVACMEEEGEVLGGVLAAKALLVKNISEDSATESFVSGGRMGVRLYDSELSGEYIKLQADYKMPLPIGLFGKKEISITQRMKCRKWTGSKNSSLTDESEVLVYITPDGHAYHRKRDCSYLSPSIRAVNGNEISVLRNTNGGKYYACMECMGDQEDVSGMVFITEYGDRFHSKRDCSRLKRTVLAIRLSEVGNRSACSRCGGE